jgi:hypothetical protein
MTVPIKGGAPRKFNTVEELETLIEAYFESCYGKDANGNSIQIRPITLEGLSYGLGCDRKTIWNYKGMKDSKNQDFFPTIKRAIDRCQVSLAEHALTAKNPAGAIWLGCNNYNYVQKVEIQATTQPEQLTPDDIKNQLEQHKKSGELTDRQE